MAAESVSIKSNDSGSIADYLCSKCKNKNTETETNVYCEMCEACFCNECVHLHSHIFQNHTTNGPIEIEEGPKEKATQEGFENCEVHAWNKLTLFCEDHGKMCCNTCVVLSHSQCSKVTLIADTTLSDHKQLSAQIDTIMDKLMKLHTNWESNMKLLHVSYEERLKELRGMRERINSALGKLEMTTLKEMDEVKDILNASLVFDIDTCSRLRTELTRLSGAIQEIDEKNEELALITRQKSEEMIKQVEKYLNNNSIQTEVSLKLIVYNDIEGYLSKFSGLGHTIHITKELAMQGSFDQAIKVTGATSISVRIPSDTYTSYYINGIYSMFNGQILIADYMNKRLKLFDREHKAVSDCEMSGSPHDMCLITPCQVAVAMGNRIQFVSVISGQLVNDRWLYLPHECRGVAHHQGDLYVTSGSALYKYNLTGTLVNKMYVGTSDSVHKCAVSPSGDKIYVTNYVNHKLFTLARNGNVISTFTDPDMQQPYGLHVTPAGQVLVCGRSSKTVIQVDIEGKKKIATVATQKDGILNPRSVFYNWQSGYFIVGQYSENILVFNCK